MRVARRLRSHEEARCGSEVLHASSRSMEGSRRRSRREFLRGFVERRRRSDSTRARISSAERWTGVGDERLEARSSTNPWHASPFHRSFVHCCARRDLASETLATRWERSASDGVGDAFAPMEAPGGSSEGDDGAKEGKKTRRKRKKRRPSPHTARKRRRRRLLRDARALVERRLFDLLKGHGGKAHLKILLEEYRLFYGAPLRFADDYGVEDARELLRALPRVYPVGQPGNAQLAFAPNGAPLKERIIILMRKHRVLRISEFNQAHAFLFGEPLRLREHGMERLVDLAVAFPDVLRLEKMVHEEGRKKGRSYGVFRIQPQASVRRRRRSTGKVRSV